MAGHPALQAMITLHGPAAQALAAADEALIRAALSGELSDEDIADGDPSWKAGGCGF